MIFTFSEHIVNVLAKSFAVYCCLLRSCFLSGYLQKIWKKETLTNKYILKKHLAFLPPGFFSSIFLKTAFVGDDTAACYL